MVSCLYSKYSTSTYYLVQSLIYVKIMLLLTIILEQSPQTLIPNMRLCFGRGILCSDFGALLQPGQKDMK